MDKQYEYDLTEILEYINPSELDYMEWLAVGMGLKEAGYSVSVWEQWSCRDTGRYHSGECEKKWAGFHGAANPTTAGTIVQMAKDRGWHPDYTGGGEIGWDDYIGGNDELVIVDKHWIEVDEEGIKEPENWDPKQEIITYLETLFEASENVGYVTETYEKDDRYLPKKGSYGRTAGQIIEALSKTDDIGSVLGDYNPEAGAWIRFNPLDGKGVKNENVTDFRYALVESDDMELAMQNAIIKELELPVACLVYSGKKSLHAIVRVDAGSYDEYRKRVDYLYDVCAKNGLKLDRQNKNPSRLSRMPGVMRAGKKQFLLGTNLGKDNWLEWHDWIESVNDDLPDPESLNDTWDNLPELSPPLIDGILRQGHKMLVAGPSKAGKSFALIELVIAIAEGRRWLKWQCTKGRVLYVNLELDRASCLHRFRDVYKALDFAPNNIGNIDIWNLRGKAIPMDKLAPKLIRRAQKKDYIAIIIDPIYKVITGDENSADQMARFCNQFDLLCHEIGAAVIYCHHHSKGSQGQKRSMDRASGSGVFARDPDALLDLLELEITDDIIKQKQTRAACGVYMDWLDRYSDTWEDHVGPDDRLSEAQMRAACDKFLLGEEQFRGLNQAVAEAKEAVKSITAWRVEGTLREYPKPAAINLWFNYPVHDIDITGVLSDIPDEPVSVGWGGNKQRKKTPKEREDERRESLETAYEVLLVNGKVTVRDMAEYMDVAEKTVRRRIKEHDDFWIDEGEIGRKS